MLAKLRRLIFTTLICSAAHAEPGDPFFHAKLGECYSSPSIFMKSILGRAPVDDINLHISKKNGWTWIVDQTATKNYAWYLLEKKRGFFCWQIYVPAATEIKFVKGARDRKMIAFVAPEADLPPKKIEFSRPRDYAKFHAYRCEKLSGTATLGRNMIVPCSTIYD